jgi:hypothetical protein
VGKLQRSEGLRRSHWSWMTSLVIQLYFCLLRIFAETGSEKVQGQLFMAALAKRPTLSAAKLSRRLLR